MTEDDIDLDQLLALLRLLYVESRPESRASAQSKVNAIAARYRIREREKAQGRLPV